MDMDRGKGVSDKRVGGKVYPKKVKKVAKVRFYREKMGGKREMENVPRFRWTRNCQLVDIFNQPLPASKIIF